MKEKNKSSKTRTAFILEDAIVRVYEDYISVCADDLCLQTSASTVDLVDSAVDRHKSF